MTFTPLLRHSATPPLRYSADTLEESTGGSGRGGDGHLLAPLPVDGLGRVNNFPRAPLPADAPTAVGSIL